MARGPVGHITRGTTNTNRLRRVDRWLTDHPAVQRAAHPLIVDLGFGASGVTAFELEARLREARDDVRVLGLEIDPARVERARSQLEEVHAGRTSFARDAHVSFARGGFEVPIASGQSPTVIRAFNVLRQYDESDVADAWARMAARLHPAGILVDGTCDELGRVCTWIEVGADAEPRSLTISLRLAELESPAIAAERLPKALIHRNIPGEGVHALLAALDDEWTRSVSASAFGPRQRWLAALNALKASGWQIGARRRWRLGEFTVPWTEVKPQPSRR